MCNIVTELSKRVVFWALIRIERWTSWIGLGIEPVTIIIRTCSMVTSENVVWVSDPETSWGLIRVQKTP